MKRPKHLNSPLWRLVTDSFKLIAGKRSRRALIEYAGNKYCTPRQIYDRPLTRVANIERMENRLREFLSYTRTTEHYAHVNRDAALAALIDRIDRAQDNRRSPGMAPYPEGFDAEFAADHSVIKWRPRK